MSGKENKVYNLSDIIGDGTQLAQKYIFNFGDWVYIPTIDEKGKVIGRHYDEQWEEDSLTLRMQDGREMKVLESNCKPTDHDPKTAFLTELSELLRKYDAKIDLGFAGHDGENPYINITLGNNGDVEWTDSDFYNKDFRFPLTADNVFNYDKE